MENSAEKGSNEKLFTYKSLKDLEEVNKEEKQIPNNVLIDLADVGIMASKDGDSVVVEDRINGGYHKLSEKYFK